MTPVLEITFQNIAGSPWEGEATVKFQGEPSEPFAVREGMAEKDLREVRWYIEEYMDFPEGSYTVRAGQVERKLAEWGQSLWQGIQDSPDVSLWMGFVLGAQSGRLELRAKTASDEIAFRTPWELMRVSMGQNDSTGRLLHQLGVTVGRRVNANLPRLHPADTSKGLRILAIVCRPDEAGFIHPRYTPEAILDALEKRPEVSVDFCRPATLAALTDELQAAKDNGEPYHVVHFDGHGTTLPHEGGIGALCFEAADGSMDLVRATQFGDLMSRFDIPLVVLEACRTATKAFAQETLASALLRQGVGSVVAMGHAVHVDMTRELMSAFYESIARGRPVGDALQAGRNRIYATMQRRTRIVPDAPTVKLHDWFVPQLYQGGEDPELLTKKPSRRRPAKRGELHGFPPPQGPDSTAAAESCTGWSGSSSIIPSS